MSGLPDLQPLVPRDPRVLPLPQQSPVRPPAPPLPAPPPLTSAAQTPLRPSGTAFLRLHLINSPSHYILPQKMSLFSSVSVHPGLKYLFALAGIQDPRSQGRWRAQNTGACLPGRSEARAPPPCCTCPSLCSGWPQFPLTRRCSSCRERQVGSGRERSRAGAGSGAGPAASRKVSSSPAGHRFCGGGAPPSPDSLPC